jgi:hypothetical protein
MRANFPESPSLAYSAKFQLRETGDVAKHLVGGRFA